MKRLLILLALAAVAAGATFAIPAFAATKTITVKDNFFTPKKVTVKRGTTVVWKFRGAVAHNVTVVSGPKKFHSPTQQKGTYKATPHRKGVYHIVCTIHAGMEMTLKVR